MNTCSPYDVLTNITIKKSSRISKTKTAFDKIQKIKFNYFLFFFITSFFYSQDKFPVYNGCENLSNKELQKCFYSKIEDHFKTNINQQFVKDKVTIINVFAIDTIGNFKLIFTDASNEDFKSEIERVFGLLPKIGPASYNGKKIFSKYTLKLHFPFDKELIGDEESVNIKHGEVDGMVYKKFENLQFQSGLNIPYHHNTYNLFEESLDKVGVNFHASSKPFNFSEVSKYKDLLTSQKSLLLNKKSWWGRKFFDENLIQIQGEDYWFTLNLAMDLRLGKDFSSQLKYTYVNTRAVTINGGLGNNFTFNATVYESQGRFADYYNRFSESIKPVGGNPATIPGIGNAKEFGTTAYDFPLAEANIKYTSNKFFDFTLGYSRNFIGDGYRSLFQSDGTSPYPFFKINTTFWKLKYTNTYMVLKDVSQAYLADNTYATKYMVNHFLSWNVNNRINLGFFESVVWTNANNRGFDPYFLNPIIFYRAVEFAASPKSGNALLGISGKYKITDSCNIYGQFLVDEFSVADVSKSNGSWKNKFGYQIGAKYYHAFSVKNLNLQLEYNIVRPYTYSHSESITNYTHNNQSMGHNWGANFKELIGIARYTKGRIFGQAKLIFGQKGYDFNDGINNLNYGSNLFIPYNTNRPNDFGNSVAQGNKTNIFIGDFTIGYLVNPASNMKFFGNVIFRNFSPNKPSLILPKENTTWFSIGISSELFNWYFDY